MGMTNTNMDYAGECDPSNDGKPKEITVKDLPKDSDKGNENLIHETEAEKLDMITDISNFATGIVMWHTDICNQAIHAMNMPEVHPSEGTHIAIRISTQHEKLKDEEGMRYLAPSEIEAFKAGIRYLFDQFKDLPFKFLPTDADGNVQPEYAADTVETTDAPEAN